MKKNVEKWDWIKNQKKIKKNNRNKKTRTKLDIKIKWNKLLMDETTKTKINLKKTLKAKQIVIKRIIIKIDINTN